MMREDRPDRVLLDLVMPVMSGEEVPAVMAVDPALRDVPVVVISTSENIDDALERKLTRLVKPLRPRVYASWQPLSPQDGRPQAPRAPSPPARACATC